MGHCAGFAARSKTPCALPRCVASVAAEARRILHDAGLLAADAPATATPLPGGIAADVLLVESAAARFIVKRPRPAYNTAEEWYVPVERAHVEARAARLYATHLPGNVPALLAHDEATHTLVYAAAPTGSRTWKDELLSARVDLETAAAAGALLARLHGIAPSLKPDASREDALFAAQRSVPYFHTAAMRVPRARPAIESLLHAFRSETGLVHGDYSPKNLLVSPDRDSLLLIDHEVTTRGDTAFDVGFLLTHLILKAIHMPSASAQLLGAAHRFSTTYESAAMPEDVARLGRAPAWTGALLVARAVGKSVPEYLTAREQAQTAKLGLELLTAPPFDVERLLAYLASTHFR
jgi:aminoglycoside phosphotransferase (APT) family kinase protein